MSKEYNLQSIRELINAALSTNQILNLAQDIFPSVYRNFSPGMTADQHIRDILDHAERYGRMEQMLHYIREQNPHQYNQYADRLSKPQSNMNSADLPQTENITAILAPTSPLAESNDRRLEDLKTNIEREQALLKSYEEQFRLETDTRRILKIQHEMGRQKDVIEKYEAEMAELLGTPRQPKSEGPTAVAPTDNIITAKLPPLVAREKTAEPAEPAKLIPGEQAEEDIQLQYVPEEQPWFPRKITRLKQITIAQQERLPSEIEVVIMVATRVELDAALNLLAPLPRFKNIIRSYVGTETYFLGRYGEVKTAVTRCGLGSGSDRGSALATQDAIPTWEPKAIIMPGIAFGKNSAKQRLADVLVATQIIPYEKQRRGIQTIFRDPIPPSNATLLNRFENAIDWNFKRPDGLFCELLAGPLLSGEKLVDDAECKAELFDKFPEAIGGEMEGAGLAAAAGRNHIPWILVKAICDWGDGTKHDNHRALAAAASVSLVHHILSQSDALNGL